ncbi:MAG: hypothetical protein GF400_07370 [Candidatus Eisenbacteria bacterium]|nr:hypothetical protein [Candidatus Eisenbacteria bacterium]
MKGYESNPCEETASSLEEALLHAEQAASALAPEVGVTLSRLATFNDDHALALMRHLVEHPELKDRGMSRFLSDYLEYWDGLSAAVDSYVSEHPEEAERIEQEVRAVASDFMVY